ncbi:MAG: hypothetical protein D6689_21485 [Deltaproteobacteria bacterium]|nr:MAG: hypothetical protein D6689_21485 [Deltaproteobacteria bacterium]
MPAVFLALDDLGLGIQWSDWLEAGGYDVAWSRTPAGPPPESLDRAPAAVILGDAPNELSLEKFARSWRALEPPPAVLALARDAGAARAADAVRAVPLPVSAGAADVCALVRRAIDLRFAAELSQRFALHALGAAGVDATDPVERIIHGARDAPLDIVREALRPRAFEYVSATARVDDLRAARLLDVPAIELALRLTGAITLATAIDSAADPARSARTLWALLCAGAARLTREPPDQTTHERRAVSRARHHIRERLQRLRRGRATYYDVLDVPPDATAAEIGDARARLALRFSPQRLRHLDLGDLAAAVEPLWQQVDKATARLSDASERARYNAWLLAKGVDVAARHRGQPIDRSGAEAEFEAGQLALARGDVAKAVAFFAAAARKYPDHVDYESYLAWARYRADIDRGADRTATALRYRTEVEQLQSGRAPRPRALLALALLCAACRDDGAARWYLEEALAIDPAYEPALRLRARMG